MTVEEARKIVIEAGHRLCKEGLVARTWGNISQRIDANTIAITPSGIPYDKLTEGDIAVLNMEDMTWTGNFKPSGEKKLHVAIYKQDGSVQSVIHTHQTNASTCAAARKDLIVPEEYRAILGSTVKAAAYGLPGSKKLTNGSAEAIKGGCAALVSNHGAVVSGKTMDDAFKVAITLEAACEKFIQEKYKEVTGDMNFSEEKMHSYFLKNGR